jgi:hypothetical protein
MSGRAAVVAGSPRYYIPAMSIEEIGILKRLKPFSPFNIVMSEETRDVG